MELLTTAYDPDATEAPAAAYSEYDQYYDLYATPSAAPAGADDQGLYATPTAAPAAGRRRLDDGYDVYYGEGYCSDVNGVGLEHSVYGYSSAEECGSLCIDYGSTNGIDFVGVRYDDFGGTAYYCECQTTCDCKFGFLGTSYALVPAGTDWAASSAGGRGRGGRGRRRARRWPRRRRRSRPAPS